MNEELCWWQFVARYYLPPLATLGSALLVFFLTRNYDKRKEKYRRDNIYRALLHFIYMDLKKNIELLVQMHACLLEKSYPSFQLQLSQKDALLNAIIPVCCDWNLIEKIRNAYYELEHVQSRINQLHEKKQEMNNKSLVEQIDIESLIKKYHTETMDLIEKLITSISSILEVIAPFVGENC
jgi:hypothetical protein